MPGFDKSRIEGSADTQLDEFTCGICLAIFNDPVFVQCCRQAYCRDCIYDWLQMHNSCPFDRKQITKGEILDPPRSFNNLVGNLRVTCEYKGCPDSVKISEIHEHLKKCPYGICENCELRKEESHVCFDSLKNEVKRLEKCLAEKDVDFSTLKDLVWIKYTGCVPVGAVVAGTNNDGQNVYVGRAIYKGNGTYSLIPGTAVITADEGTCYVEYYKNGRACKDFEVLCNPGGIKLEWSNRYARKVPFNAVPGGEEDKSYVLYIGRGNHDDSTFVGKIPTDRNCYAWANGNQINLGNYEVLAYKRF